MFSPEQYRAIREGAGLVDRSNRGRIRLTGADRRAYLQGLLTNDIQALVAGAGCYACLLTAQGRMIADMYVVETGAETLMDLEPEVTRRVARHLDQFIFSEDVAVTEITEKTAQLGIFGPGAAAVVAQVFAGGPSAPSAAALTALPVLANLPVHWSDVPVTIVSRDELGGQGFDLVIDASHREALTHAIVDAGAVEVDPVVADVCRIEYGRPVFGRDMTEETIPLEAGITDRAISLTKGCYVGQEIIIRVLHRGHGRVARRLVGVALDPGSPMPVEGAAIRSADRDVGAVTSAANSPALDRPIALGYVHRDFTEPGTAVTVATEGGAASGVVAELPFVPAV